MIIKVLSHLEPYENKLSDRLKVTCHLIGELHRRYPKVQMFGFHFYDSKILMEVPKCSIHKPHSEGPLKVADYGDRIGIGLKWAKYNLNDHIEWNITDETAIALYVYYQTLLNSDFDWLGNYQGWSTKRGRRFSATELKEMFNL